jgi:hypothetical protein
MVQRHVESNWFGCDHFDKLTRYQTKIVKCLVDFKCVVKVTCCFAASIPDRFLTFFLDKYCSEFEAAQGTHIIFVSSYFAEFVMTGQIWRRRIKFAWHQFTCIKLNYISADIQIVHFTCAKMIFLLSFAQIIAQFSNSSCPDRLTTVECLRRNSTDMILSFRSMLLMHDSIPLQLPIVLCCCSSFVSSQRKISILCKGKKSPVDNVSKSFELVPHHIKKTCILNWFLGARSPVMRTNCLIEDLRIITFSKETSNHDASRNIHAICFQKALPICQMASLLQLQGPCLRIFFFFLVQETHLLLIRLSPIFSKLSTGLRSWHLASCEFIIVYSSPVELSEYNNGSFEQIWLWFSPKLSFFMLLAGFFLFGHCFSTSYC